MMSENNHIPSPALALGLGGLLPFIASAVLCCWPDAPIRGFGEFALRTYGAVILSFLGGIKWGVLINDQAGLQQWKPITLSVVPSLIAWPALLLPALPGLALLLVGFVLQYCLDRASVEQQSLPRWFGKLRFILTCGAVGALATGVLANLFL